VFHALKAGSSRASRRQRGDEGGFAPDLRSNREALESIAEAIGRPISAGRRRGPGAHVAASELFDKKTGGYQLEGKSVDRKALADLYEKWSREFPIVSIEDGFARTTGRMEAPHERLGARVQLVATISSSPTPSGYSAGSATDRQRGAHQGEPDRLATETLDCVRMAHGSGYRTVMSHRRERPRIPSSQTSRGVRLRDDQTGREPQRPTAKYTSSCASRRSSACRPLRGKTPFPARINPAVARLHERRPGEPSQLTIRGVG